ncbi:MAG: C69 family dipeptidase [Muribaculaceae bacterium]|nr:C69 family dipeptidase [Muribaculaceae bacterium]
MKMKGLFLMAGLSLLAAEAFACTNFIAGRKATTDGSVMVTYADDSYTRFGFLQHSPRGKHQPGEMRAVIDWGDDSPRGEIPQAAETYNVVGNMNEHQVVIGETTWGGHKELEDTTGNSLLDYGSLIYITLERAKTAREAIKLMGDLTDKYGYASTGETFSIADKNEAWMMEMIGKGSGEKGALWIAVRIPDDAIAAHANEPRIRKVDYKDKENVMYSKDLIKWARKHGYYSGKDEDFSFADAFSDHPVAKRRTCDSRVWSFYRHFAGPEEEAAWLKWVKGESDEPMPLYIIPDRKLSLEDMRDRMRDHYEGTALAMTEDAGAGVCGAPVRRRPLRFEYEGEPYTQERPVATPQTAWSFISQSRSDLPDALGGVFWFGTDDANTTVYLPLYCSLTEVPEELREGNGDLYNYSPTSSFWVNNAVANRAYGAYDMMIGDIREVQGGLEKNFTESRDEIDKGLAKLYEENPERFQALVNQYGAAVAKQATEAYRELDTYLLVKYLDGVRKKVDADGKFARNKYGKPKSPESVGYRPEVLKRIVEEKGEDLKLGD